MPHEGVRVRVREREGGGREERTCILKFSGSFCVVAVRSFTHEFTRVCEYN